MVKGSNVSRPSFRKVFASVNSFHAKVDYSRVMKLGEVYDADEKHDSKVIPRVRRQLPKGQSVVALCFIRPWQKDMSLGQALYLAMNHGLWPATHLETVVSLETAAPEQIGELFGQADKAVKTMGLLPATSMALACLGSAVSGQSGELILVQELERYSYKACRLHLRKLDFDAPVPPAMALPFVSRV